jgi:hypothetical protein
LTQAGVWFDASCTAYLDNAMLVVGSQYADYAPMHPADELARCLRYYEVQLAGANAYIASGQSYQATGAVFPLPFLRKAVQPTVTYTAATTFAATNGSFGVLVLTGIATNGITTTVLGIGATLASGLTAGQASTLLGAGSGAFITFEGNP